MATSFKCAPNGLEMSRPASPSLVSRQIRTLGWPGRLHRVVRRTAMLGGLGKGRHGGPGYGSWSGARIVIDPSGSTTSQ